MLDQIDPADLPVTGHHCHLTRDKLSKPDQGLGPSIEIRVSCEPQPSATEALDETAAVEQPSLLEPDDAFHVE